MEQHASQLRTDGLARASSLAARARELRRAQTEVQELTTREVEVLARTAASFFDTIPLVEFTSSLLPHSARGVRRIRHRVLHRTVQQTGIGTQIRALLLGRDGALRLFSAQSAESRDLLLILEPGRSLPVGVVRDVVDWSPTLRVPGFRLFDILGKLSQAVDAVEEQISEAEQRVQVQKAALTRGDLAALYPPAIATAPESPVRQLPATVATVAPRLASGDRQDPFAVFDRVEVVADSIAASDASVFGALASDGARSAQVEPEEWGEPIEPTDLKSQKATHPAHARASTASSTR